MKVNKRSVPLDMLSVEEDDRKITIHTHRNEIVVLIWDKALPSLPSRESHFTFSSLWSLLDKRLKGSSHHTDQ